MKNKGVLIVVVLLVLAGLGFFFFGKSQESMDRKGSSDVQMADEKADGSKVGGINSLKNLFMAGIPQTCTFESTTENVASKGTVYITKGKMRGDFESTIDDKPMSTHMIYDGEASYIWTDGEKRGFKMEMSQEEIMKANEEIDSMPKDENKAQGAVDLDQELNYDCKPWIANGNMFALPTDVEFSSMNEMMEELTGQMGSQCSVCEELEGEAKTSCLSALKCN